MSVDSTVCASDFGANNKLFLDTKSKVLNTDVAQINVSEKAIGMENDDAVEVNKTVGETTYNSFVGFGDEFDYAEVVFNDTGTCTFELQTWGTAKASSKLTVYKLTLKNGKWTKKAVGSLKVRNTSDVIDGYASGSGSKPGIKIDAATSDNVKYYVSMQSVDAKKGKEVYYNVSAAFTGSNEAALAMPETDSLAMTDDLSFGQYADVDTLASASASTLADLDDKASWMNFASLA